jgi:hypothetical protein
MRALSLLTCCLLLTSPVQRQAEAAPNAVTDWAAIAQHAIHNPAAPRPPASAFVLHAMIVLAMYDAAMAIEGGYEPFAADIPASSWADVRAAVAAAAYETARARVAPSALAFLDEQYGAYLEGIADGPAKDAGIEAGRKAAAAMLILRANDGFDSVVPYSCSSNPPPPGEFEPNTGCPANPADPQPVDAKVAQISPFTFSNPDAFRSNGPNPLTSRAYATDFMETRDYGRFDSAVRSPAQTDIAYFWSEHALVHWNRNLIGLAISRGLSLRETARLFAMVYTASADALIAGFEAKYFYATWRPRTAIPLADMDGNSKTDADPTWTPLLQVNHPEYPAAHGFLSTAVTDTVAAFFGTHKVTWTIETPQHAVPQVVQTLRTYTDLNALMREIDSARVWAGLHWRHSTRHGGQIGRKVARHVVRNFFRPTP